MSKPMGKLNLQGAVDLSALAQARSAAAQPSSSSASHVIIDVTDATFEREVLTLSRTVPVIVDIWATWCGPCKQLSPVLEKLVTEQAGRLVLAKIDADANPALMQAFQVQSIPSVFLVLNGQVQPLFQGAVPESQLRPLFEQIMQIAQQQGIVGSVAASEENVDETVEPPVDPRLQAAYDAIDAGEWDAAESAYQQLLTSNPQDGEAQAGLYQVGLMRRTDGVDLDAVIASEPQILEERLLQADVLLLLGETIRAYNMLIDGVRNYSDDERKACRDRLLEYFVIAGETPEVIVARRNLTNALF